MVKTFEYIVPPERHLLSVLSKAVTAFPAEATFVHMNSIITHAQQYVQQHPFELYGSVVIAAAFGLYLTWWKRAEDHDLDEDEAEENPTESKPDQPTSGQTAKVTKVNRPPP